MPINRPNVPQSQLIVRLSQSGTDYLISFSKDMTFIAQFKKEVPAYARGWDKETATWAFDPEYLYLYRDIFENRFGQVEWPNAQKFIPHQTNLQFRLHYLGNCRTQEDLDNSASSGKGFASDMDWSYIFWYSALVKWFDGTDKRRRKAVSQADKSYYEILHVTEKAPFDTFRKAWVVALNEVHPDHHPESENAHWNEEAKKVNEAYEVLRDPRSRAQYDVGLRLERAERAQLNSSLAPSFEGEHKHYRKYSTKMYSPPIRCGEISANGYYRFGHFNVMNILSWEDITDATGRVLVTEFDSIDPRHMHVVEYWR